MGQSVNKNMFVHPNRNTVHFVMTISVLAHLITMLHKSILIISLERFPIMNKNKDVCDISAEEKSTEIGVQCSTYEVPTQSLHKAVQLGDIEKVRSLLQHDVYVRELFRRLVT